MKQWCPLYVFYILIGKDVLTLHDTPDVNISIIFALHPILVTERLLALWPFRLTLKHRETHGCVVSTVTTDALVLKHQAISIHNAD